MPQWSDQMRDAKFIDEIWKIGMRPKLDELFGIVGREELLFCLNEDLSSLTHMCNYNDHHSHHQDFKFLTGFQAISTNSGSEVENSVGTEFGTNELGYTTCLSRPPPPAPAPIPAPT
ncbi:hypothetical protein T459_08939 [Capsicum annuum]|uniref:Uncharacterized protein n=1 Tax=Capsicum annuum TaxID=4072 RepID=A0A2G2ZXX0_CAPAN|nr:hypothetical protein FXO37_02234 [Capsicum annuum]PHT86833.1 hypothetical protein T459_08939 [Capsicum annuum]